MERPRHQEHVTDVAAPPSEVFELLDDQQSLSAHMTRRGSPMMGGGSMTTTMDDGAGKTIGSRIRMEGKAFGLEVRLDEVVIARTPPASKAWQTIDSRLIVIGAYTMGFDIEPLGIGSRLRVWIDYQPPTDRPVVGLLGGKLYARWCVRQMASVASRRFPAM